MKKYNIYVTAKQGIFDPAGAQSKHALDNLGYDGVGGVKIGKFIELEVSDDTPVDQVAQMCDRLLANPVIEDYRIEEAGK
jgi:phosphoribosylformylglycinamidine synthase